MIFPLVSVILCTGLLPEAEDPPVLHAEFESDTDGFVFVTDAFRGTSEPGYAAGVRDPSGGFSGAGLRVDLGGVDRLNIFGMSGGWRRTFTVQESGRFVLSFRFELTQAAGYEPDEESQVLVSVDGVLSGAVSTVDYAGMVAGDGNGGDPRSLGWKLFRVDLDLDVGEHELVIGGYNNKKTLANEFTSIALDDVRVESAGEEIGGAAAGPSAVLGGLSYQRFVDNIEALAGFGDREQGSTSYDDAEAWLIAELQSAGYTVEHHEYGFGGEVRRSTYVTKVGVTRPDLMFIVSAHFDGRGGGGGADDDASGCSLVLEGARAFAQPGVETEISVRFVFWNNEETGLEGSLAYVDDRSELQGVESPPGTGLHPEPRWLGIIQHDMILWDHGLPSQPQQDPAADIDVEYRADSGRTQESLALANALLGGNAIYSTDYPAELGSEMRNTDSMPFRFSCAAVSVRENQRGTEIGNGSNPHWHEPSDVFSTYSDLDFRLGFNALQMTAGTVAGLVGTHLHGAIVSFGAGCPGTAGTPSMNPRPGARPFVGEVLGLRMEPLPEGAAFGLVGLSRTSWGELDLPLDLGPVFGMPGCSAFISPQGSYALANTGGAADWDLDLRPDPSLVGVTFYLQGAVFDSGANAGGIVVSNALQATIGIR